MDKKKFFKMLPSVDELLNEEKIKTFAKDYPRELVVESIRKNIQSKRQEILSLEEEEFENFTIDQDEMIDQIIGGFQSEYELSLRKVINGTGVVIHTNLGRAPLSEDIKEEMWSVVSGYSNLEFDLETGKRGSRYTHLESIIKKLTGAEDVLVVNNNAAAVLLVLTTLAKEREVIVSRGELVEIGGSFRIPRVMEQGGAKLVEVGSTNKTHVEDYEEAITQETAALMKVHTSNYRVVGFTKEVSLEELSKLAKKHDMPLIEDLGSGVFIDFSKYGITYEPTVQDSVKKGVDIVTFSGDKILGAPQAGIIVGKSEYIKKMKKNQLTRALRVDKLTIAALEATLRMYLDEEKAIKSIPGLRMLTYKMDELIEKADALKTEIEGRKLKLKIDIEDGFSQVGGGSLPLERLASKVITLVPENMSVSKLEEGLRLSKSHIIGRIHEDRYILDARTIFEDEYVVIADELEKILK